jgi:hypothetical protein
MVADATVSLRISQLVSEHREELVFLPVGLGKRCSSVWGALFKSGIVRIRVVASCDVAWGAQPVPSPRRRAGSASISPRGSRSGRPRCQGCKRCNSEEIERPAEVVAPHNKEKRLARFSEGRYPCGSMRTG